MWEWHDTVRAIGFLACATCFLILCVRFKKHHWSWNVKTTDYWYALAMWTFTGAASSVEGVLLDTEPGFRLVFIIAGGLVTLKALMRKGAWGENSAEDQNVQ